MRLELLPAVNLKLEPGAIVFEGTPAELVAGRSTLTDEHLATYIAPVN